MVSSSERVEVGGGGGGRGTVGTVGDAGATTEAEDWAMICVCS